MPTITIFRGTDGYWQADMSHADHALEIKQLFGTAILPTVWINSELADKVQKGVQELNPGHKVIVKAN